MKRRELLKAAVAGGVAAAMAQGRAGGGAPAVPAAGAPAAPVATLPKSGRELAKKLPRWRGFNLLEKFNLGSNKPFVESDFEWIHEWGFNFVRLPMDYRCWTDKDDPYKVNEAVLKEIDQAVAFGRKHGVHVNLCLHRAPGYTVASPPEKLDLWAEEEPLKQFAFQWGQFARRCKGLPSTEVSFDLVNEPNAKVTGEAYRKVAERVVAAIRQEDPDRLIVADGTSWGTKPVPELADLGIAQSTRGYAPVQVSHYKAGWMGGSDKWPEPTWPLKQKDKALDKQWLYDQYIAPFKALEARGVGVHVGEGGAYNLTPHGVVLAWMRDWLTLWKEAGWGWALWNLRGSFGIVDSKRRDVTYEDFHGHQLDRKYLDLLREV